MCHSIVLVQLGIQERERHAEEISRLEHQLAEASGHLKQSLVVNTDLSNKMAQEAVERELAQREAAEAGHRLAAVKAELARVEAKNTELNKMVEERDEKLSSSVTELATLQAIKDKTEAELDRNFEETEELLKQSFLRAVRQAHVLYGGLPTSGAFDLDHEMYQDRLMPSAKASALAAQEAAPVEGETGKGHEDNQD